MDGKIRTKERCPKCGDKFSGEPLACKTCLTHPKKYYIDLYLKNYGKLKVYSDHRGITIDSWETASRAITRIRTEIEDRTFDPTKWAAKDLKKFLFETQVELWHKDKEKEKDNGLLAKGYVRILRTYIDKYYLDYFKGYDVRDIRAHHIKDFYRNMPKKSPKYTKNILKALQHFFNTLSEDEFIQRPPAFPEIEMEKKLPRWVDFPTQIKIIKTLPREDRHIFLFLAWQGVRPGEARALKVKDVDMEQGVLYIRRTYSGGEIKERTKGKRESLRAVNPALMGLLKKSCANKTPETFVFINPRTGGAYSETCFKRYWHMNPKGIEITPYQATRHSLASQLLKNEVHLDTIKDILGHTDIRTTLKYAHGNMDNQRLGFRRHNKSKVLRLVRPQRGPEPDKAEENVK